MMKVFFVVMILFVTATTGNSNVLFDCSYKKANHSLVNDLIKTDKKQAKKLARSKKQNAKKIAADNKKKWKEERAKVRMNNKNPIRSRY